MPCTAFLLNFERDSKPWLSLILVGLRELRETLKRNVLQSLTARIPIRVHLAPLDAEQVKQYVRHRLAAAGCRREVFADDGLLLLAKAIGGIMRRIDVVATRCLELAAKGKCNLVDATLAEAAIRDCAEALADDMWTIEVEMRGFAIIRQDVVTSPNMSAGEWELQMLPLDQIQAVVQPSAATMNSSPAKSGPGQPEPDKIRLRRGKHQKRNVTNLLEPTTPDFRQLIAWVTLSRPRRSRLSMEPPID